MNRSFFPTDEMFLHWINVDIPRFLDKYETYEQFEKVIKRVDTSSDWKKIAYAMAKERWGIKEIKSIPS